MPSSTPDPIRAPQAPGGGERSPAPPLRLRPSLQPYAWGDAAFIPELLGLEGWKGPCAEAWFGAHPRAPASVLPDGAPLDRFLARQGAAYLGPSVASRHEGLPYLLKLLAARRPLSIQTHPDLDQARRGFAREEAAGIPRGAPNRCYRDANHKPEILLALTDVHAICGFRRGEELLAALDAVPELSSLLPGPEGGDPRELAAVLQAYYALPDAAVAPALSALMTRLESEEPAGGHVDTTPEYWVLEASRTLFDGGPPDRGVLFVYLLHHVHLSRGQALFLAPGVPHAYLRGAGVELMATSDNVLRAGLTQKHVDAAELLRIVKFEGGDSYVVEPSRGEAPGESRYLTPGTGLRLLRLQAGAGETLHRTVVGPETWLNVSDAPVTIRSKGSGGDEVILRRGEAVLLAHGTRVSVRGGTPDAPGALDVHVAGVSTEP